MVDRDASSLHAPSFDGTRRTRQSSMLRLTLETLSKFSSGHGFGSRKTLWSDDCYSVNRTTQNYTGDRALKAQIIRRDMQGARIQPTAAC